MKNLFFTPGPTHLYPTVPQHYYTALKEDILSISHRSTVFQSIFNQTTYNLRMLLEIPDNYHIFFLSSATEIMERIIQNSVENTSFHFINGAFSQLFSQISRNLKKEVLTHEVDSKECFLFDRVKIPFTTELIAFTQNETSIGYAINPQDIYNIHKKYPDVLIAVDIVSAAPYIHLDYSQIDYAFFSVQKGFGLPAGLGVLILSPRALTKSEYLLNKGISIGSYHTFPKLQSYASKNQTPETPNVLGIYLLGKVTDDMLSRGRDTLRSETDEKASALYSFFENHPNYTPYISCKNVRSQTVVVIECKHGSQTIIDNLKHHKIILGSGYKSYRTRHIRIANFPAHTIQEVQRLISLF